MHKEVLNETKQKAKEGDAEAQYDLALAFLYNKNMGEGLSYLTKAADQGHVDAQFHLARIYEGGMYNYEEAVKWYVKAAEQGHIRAQTNLAQMYHKGNGVTQNCKEAFKWFGRAANNEK